MKDWRRRVISQVQLDSIFRQNIAKLEKVNPKSIGLLPLEKVLIHSLDHGLKMFYF